MKYFRYWSTTSLLIKELYSFIYFICWLLNLFTALLLQAQSGEQHFAHYHYQMFKLFKNISIKYSNTLMDDLEKATQAENVKSKSNSLILPDNVVDSVSRSMHCPLHCSTTPHYTPLLHYNTTGKIKDLPLEQIFEQESFQYKILDKVCKNKLTAKIPGIICPPAQQPLRRGIFQGTFLNPYIMNSTDTTPLTASFWVSTTLKGTPRKTAKQTTTRGPLQSCSCFSFHLSTFPHVSTFHYGYYLQFKSLPFPVYSLVVPPAF